MAIPLLYIFPIESKSFHCFFYKYNLYLKTNMGIELSCFFFFCYFEKKSAFFNQRIFAFTYSQKRLLKDCFLNVKVLYILFSRWQIDKHTKEGNSKIKSIFILNGSVALLWRNAKCKCKCKFANKRTQANEHCSK